MISQFVAKKLGEVSAFALVSIETFEKGLFAFHEVLGEHQTRKIIETNTFVLTRLKHIVVHADKTEIVEAKMETTAARLHDMRNLYVRDQWSNPTELMEWLGFFEGAAYVHWKLVQGAAETMEDNEELRKLAREQTVFHNQLLELSAQYLYDVGFQNNEPKTELS